MFGVVHRKNARHFEGRITPSKDAGGGGCARIVLPDFGGFERPLRVQNVQAGTVSPSPGARNKFASRPCWRM
jgi:hypothetical protein